MEESGATRDSAKIDASLAFVLQGFNLKLLQPIQKLLVSMPDLRRVLVAFSGGADSTALLHCLYPLQAEFKLVLGVAHVDHGWRKTSADEAAALQDEVLKMGMPFYLKVLKMNQLNGNLEENCRLERLKFFKEICAQEQYQAIFFAHHQDDLAETVLKRVLEGASFQALPGMSEVTHFGPLTILRPWLGVSKQTILSFLAEQKLTFIVDKTNLDPKFLRGRMRTEIFPLVESSFGKLISAPLARLSIECQELNAFMRDKWGWLFHHELPWKRYLDGSTIDNPFEMRWIVREWCKKLELEPSYQMVDDLVDLLLEGKVDRQIRLGKHQLEVDRKQCFLREVPSDLPQPIELREGINQWGEWQIQLEKGIKEEKLGWQAAWEGELVARLPRGKYRVGSYRDLISDKKKFLKRLSEAKVPTFMRASVPIVSEIEGVVHEFLSQRGGAILKPTLPPRSSGDKSQDGVQDSPPARKANLDESWPMRDGSNIDSCLALSTQEIVGKVGLNEEWVVIVRRN